MSESYPENPRGLRERASRWKTTNRGRRTLKAAYTQAANDVKRMDPAVRERIGRANLTPADLQQLASLHVDAQFRPDRYAGVSEHLGQEAQGRLAQSGPAPSTNWVARKNPFSRWNRNQRQGTKALKAALTQASRDVKRTDPRVLYAIGRSHVNPADLAALASGRMDQVFRPEGRFQGVPGQQAQNGAGRQAQGIQSRDAVRQEPAPQQSDQMTQRIAALQQSILANQQQALTLMEENNRLQAEMRQLLETRVQQIQQEVAGLNEAMRPQQELGQQPGRQLNDDVQFNRVVPELNPNQQQPGDNQPEARGDNQPDGQRTEGEVEGGDRQAQGEQTGEHQRGEGEEPRAEGEQSETGERPAEGEPQREDENEAERGDGNEAERGDGGESQAVQGGQEVAGGEPQTAPPTQQDLSDDWTVSAETQGESARAQEARAENRQPGAETQQPGINGQQPGVNPQRPLLDAQRMQQRGPAAGQKTAADVDTKFARDIAFSGQTPLNSVSSEQSDGAVKAGGDDPNKRQRGNQAPTRNNTPSGKDSR